MEADPFPFITKVTMQDAMLYSPKIKPISWPEDVTLDSIKFFNLLLDGFEVIVEANLWLTKNHSDGA